MAVKKDLFGFDELEKSFIKLEKRYPNQADALLMAMGRQVNKRVKAQTAVKTKKLRNSWRLKKVKLYKGGTVRVVREQSTAPHGHLYELGHEQVSGGRTRVRGKNLNRVQRAVRGVKSHGRVEGRFVLEKTMTEARQRFNTSAQQMLDKLIDSEGLGV